MTSFEPRCSGVSSPWPDDVGILAIEIYFPKLYVAQAELEQFGGVSEGKYTIGLGQSKMGFCSDREDVHSLCLTAFSRLMEKTGVGYENIGRLDVGTETLLDKSKSVKSVLMTLFENSGNADVEGVDSTNACYGGTAALLNAIHWVESSAWDGRLAAVVAADIAVYADGPARPTGGAGAVAMLIGPNAPLVIDRGVLGCYMAHTYDFYKPDFSSQYPLVDGKLSIECYLTALDACYKSYLTKAARKNSQIPSEEKEGKLPSNLDDFDAFAFHSPFCKLVQKSFARLAFNDFLRCPPSAASQKYSTLLHYRDRRLEDTYSDKEVEKAFVASTKAEFEAKTKPSLLLASQVGNMYTPSLYGGLVSILASSSAEKLSGKRIGLFSYGSGTASSMFSLRISDSTDALRAMVRDATDAVHGRLDSRVKVSPVDFSRSLKEREATHHKAPYTPTGDMSSLFPGTWFLTQVDEKHRRRYSRVPSTTPISADYDAHPVFIRSKEMGSVGPSFQHTPSKVNGHSACASNGNGSHVRNPDLSELATG